MAEVIRDGVTARTSWAEHARIIEALMGGDVETTASEMQSHIDHAATKTIAVLKTRDAESPAT